MVEFIIDNEWCDNCKRLYDLEDIVIMYGKIYLVDGCTYFEGKAFCKSCESKNQNKNTNKVLKMVHKKFGSLKE